ncbi:hypothetical protein QBC47DRAFT_376674 [Echria macrotheca]|uniref:Pentatricopeptide repeat domain-containing protein n=1 Tax=Echria macrotheca TaxID=438768 RepID=A0AAJ0BIV5_9PEZI|nr:hypothetical protein QBC47DRAFT_376674 [Echria macrotheca]
MPPRTFLLDLRRTSYVCQSCLATLRTKTNNPQPWLVRHASGTARRSPLRAATAKSADQTPNSAAGDGLKDLLWELQKIQNEEAPEDPEELARLDAEIEEDSRKLAEFEKKHEQLAVRYYDADPSGRLKQVRGNDELNQMGNGLDTETEKHIDDLEKHILNTIGMLQAMKDEGMGDKAEELQKRLKKTLREQYKGKTGPSAEVYGLLRIPGFGGPKQRSVAQLNAFFMRDSVVQGGIPKQKDLVECWKYYSAARKTLSSAWGNVPQEVWDFLWMVLSWEGGVDNPNKMHHIYVLAKDMDAAGVALRESQQLLAIEAMFIEGFQEQAIEAWKKGVVTLGSKRETFKGYWELGVRMCAHHGDIERALRAADTLLSSSEEFEPRILMPIIRALSMKEDTGEQAWETYQEMRTLLGDTMKLEDYDEVVSIFLTTNRMEFALQAFVDMMFSGALDIRGKTKLPIAVSNQFFVGKWLKRLIGAGDLDGAHKVIVYLQEKGITTSPIQLNGLLGAWIRSDVAENVEKAERLAWDMINSRLSYVDARARQASLDKLVRFYDPVRRTTEEGAFNCGTRATAETFSLLAESYCTRGLHDRLEHLWKAYQQSGIGATSFFLNQLMRSYTQNGQADEAVKLYREIIQERRIHPDAHTFIAIFNTLSVNRLVTRDSELAERDIALGRKFFADMVRASWTFDGPDTVLQLSRIILFSMMKAKDFVGMIVAIRAMDALFGFAPPEPLLIELASGTETLRVRTKRNVARILEANRTIDGLMKRYAEQLAAQRGGVVVDVGSMTEEQRGDQRRDVLENLVLIKARALDINREKLGMLVEEAARDMGVYDIVVRRDPGAIARCRKILPGRVGGGTEVVV